jgi:hypothetical protein
MILILILAAVGVLLNIAGRILILREDAALEGPTRMGVAVCPGVELFYVIVLWERARVGSALCALSLALTIPLWGQVAVLSKVPDKTGAPAGIVAAFEGMLGEQTSPARSKQKQSDAERVVKAKSDKVAELNRFVAEWYNLLRSKEPYLCDDTPEETQDFNRSAAGYHSLLSVTKTEIAELDRLKENTGSSAR